MAQTTTGAGKTPFSSYQKRLFVFLSVATFFEGYDFIAITQILPELRADMQLDKGDAGVLLGVINAGTILAYVLVRMADQWGRRRLLTVTIAGYTIATFLTGLATGPVSFAICQLVARTFLIAEWATSMVYAAEEFPADRRGMVIGVISASSSLGGIVCAGAVPFLTSLPYGWRVVYFAGIVPLIILAYTRRNLRETRRFAGRVVGTTRRSVLYILSTPYRGRLLLLATIWGLTYVCSQNAVSLWKDFAVNERALTAGQAALAITIAAVVSAPLIFAIGKVMDTVGRKLAAVLIFASLCIGVYFAYALHDQWGLTAALTAALLGVSGFLPVLNAFTTELFPTELRGDAFAWANNLLGRLPYVLSPFAVGWVARELNWSIAVRATALFPIAALILVLLFLPETKNKELEETASIP